MSAKHTQGPWRVSGAALDGFIPIMAPGGVIVALLSTLSSETIANACLIAAAPELLEALSEFITSADAGHVSVETDRKARAAIAKAEGGLSK